LFGRRYPGLGFALLGLALVLGGCPCDLSLLDPSQVDNAQTLNELAEPGLYWIGDVGGSLAAYRLPVTRGDAGEWTDLSGSPGTWFSEDGFYQQGEDLSWTFERPADLRELDDFLQVYDPPPQLITEN